MAKKKKAFNICEKFQKHIDTIVAGSYENVTPTDLFDMAIDMRRIIKAMERVSDNYKMYLIESIKLSASEAFCKLLKPYQQIPILKLAGKLEKMIDADCGWIVKGGK